MKFINLSNHPSSKWGADQLAAAQAFGEIYDIPFPNVPPAYSEEDIEALATEYINQIKLLADSQLPIVHIMGEMTLTYTIVSRLKSMGVTCLAATTERKSKELPNDNKALTFFRSLFLRMFLRSKNIPKAAKITSFSFVRFRKY